MKNFIIIMKNNFKNKIIVDFKIKLVIKIITTITIILKNILKIVKRINKKNKKVKNIIFYHHLKK
jgi:hypothetical protein